MLSLASKRNNTANCVALDGDFTRDHFAGRTYSWGHEWLPAFCSGLVIVRQRVESTEKNAHNSQRKIRQQSPNG